MVQPSTFCLPKDPKVPIIMVGIGKGISPLIGFPQGRAIEKQKSSDVGLISLFFGYQNEPQFIYNDMIQELERGGMSKLYLALS